MNHASFEKKRGKPRILVAPLDWGLGHATRVIPIIRELHELGADVWVAGEGAQEQLLKTEFPGIPFLPLKGYRVRYAATAWGLFRQLVVQSPGLLRAIKREHTWLKHAIQEYQLDAVISDNRYGLYSAAIPCIFITHQLQIKSLLGKWGEGLLQKSNYRYIQRFTECWVPDYEGEGLAGELSHPRKLPAIPVRYLGMLSRFESKLTGDIKGNLLFMLSGPEPQRTILENAIVTQVAHYPGHAVIVRGLPGESRIIPSTNMIRFYNHLPTADLQEVIAHAEYIICRSGYSTVMDLAALQKKSIMIPTPGQTEQEYLGTYLQQKKFTVCIAQKDFSLNKALQQAAHFNYIFPKAGRAEFKMTIAEFFNAVLHR